jgi:signal recognition particle GTPase
MNIDNLIFVLNSYKKYKIQNKDDKKFLENLKSLFLQGDIEKDVYNAMLYIITGNVKEPKVKSVDPCSRTPIHIPDPCSSPSRGGC